MRLEHWNIVYQMKLNIFDNSILKSEFDKIQEVSKNITIFLGILGIKRIHMIILAN